MADDVVALHPEAQSFVESVKSGTVPRHYQGRPLDVVNRPAHYAAGGIEVIDFIEQIVANYPPEIGYHIGNVLKYLSRGPLKSNMVEDMSKAEWYLKRAINKAVAAKPKVNRG